MGFKERFASWLRGSRKADVSICIPAWQSEAFIEKTLRCASAQTHRRLEILVSVDRCEDRTAEICREHARDDRRIRLFVQEERLGWAGNVNFLLEKVDTEFFSIYFHDDLILPTYVERLLGLLRAEPDAASAHCDVQRFGGNERVAPGHAYRAATAQRLVEFLVAPKHGSLLRSLTRTRKMGERFGLPTEAGGFWAQEPYLLRLLAAGPALHLPEPLYQRWDKREGGLTDAWKKYSFDQLLEGFRASTAASLALLRQTDLTPAERELVVFCLYLKVMPRIRVAETGNRIPAREAHPAFEALTLPAGLDRYGKQIEQWILAQHDRLRQLEEA